ncbi:MAG: 50S ribosomal protein L25 [Candidatus Vogelbacteria bacterium CG10_big_fil_rev_8_21_14_0_10_51_16]|uniref:Large ribosomal subunit protein bL25 n=1 Tax=Candidatus Vogelbacteria bacterium CG10_big_fil_rev_8_21_14_0_10_51_16 TaxID=1975045 RepID=A0A2H0RFM7_9BACT|nr:MAG: 50S ribosomal protein L25 [Candidatus Vogelbacteria bacterium CG10_big_fil_rev_8_21_14_0_10_51_16]
MLTLNAEIRTEKAKQLEAVRKQGKLPAVSYGPKEENTNLLVDGLAFKKVWEKAGESSVISLKTPAGEKDVLIHDVHVHPVSGVPLHVDFYAIEAGKLLQVEVPLEFIGIAPAVKLLGGVLVKVVHELEVEAMPRALPHEIEVDVSALVTFDDQITIADIKLPTGVRAMGDPEEVVALVSAPKEEEEIPATTIADIEVVDKKGKKEEEGAPAEGEDKQKE